MHGLMRVRGFTQDDGHIFCTEDQIMQETENFIELLSKIYSDLGFNNFDIKLSTRPENRVGSDEIWDKAEKSLEDAIKHQGSIMKLMKAMEHFMALNLILSLPMLLVESGNVVLFKQTLIFQLD